jgi:hypothetical protein
MAGLVWNFGMLAAGNGVLTLVVAFGLRFTC